MSRLKIEDSKTCFSVLREFIADAPLVGSKKERAMLALEQLQKITAGTGSPNDPGSVNGNDVGTVESELAGPGCLGRPRAW